VKVTRISSEKMALHLGRSETHLLLGVLSMYPRVPSGHQRLSKLSRLPDEESSQHLLDEALAEQRAENKNRWALLLADTSRFHQDETGCRLLLTDGDLEWLLQILNDIRVGSWLALGAPEKAPKVRDSLSARDVWAMEMSGYFQMQLLAALEGGGNAGGDVE
jgi:hypothetical protein